MSRTYHKDIPTYKYIEETFGSPRVYRSVHKGDKLELVTIKNGEINFDIGTRDIKVWRDGEWLFTMKAEDFVDVAQVWQRHYGEKFAPYSPPGDLREWTCPNCGTKQNLRETLAAVGIRPRCRACGHIKI